jgi:hypothetical protein
LPKATFESFLDTTPTLAMVCMSSDSTKDCHNSSVSPNPGNQDCHYTET